MKPIDMTVTDYNCEDLGLSRLCLMENAGKGVSDEIAKLSTFTFLKPAKIIIFSGSGGNGGDGFVAGRHLLNRGFEVEILLLSNYIKSKDSRINLNILKNMKPSFSKLTVRYIDSIEDLKDMNPFKSDSFSDFIIVDAILGTGIKGKLKTKIRKAIKLINKSNGLKVSIDVPSGIDPENGEISDIAVKPDYTVSLHKTKSGVKTAGKKLVGDMISCDIGIPIEAQIFLGSGDILRIKNRSNYSHKGENGKILIVGGNNNYSGAPSIAGFSALSTGLDLVYIGSPKKNSLAIKSYSPDFIVKPLEGDYLNLDNQEDILKIADIVDAALLGLGAGVEEETAKLFNILISKIKKPIVLDADALKMVDLNLIRNKKDLIITPHFQEFKIFFKDIIEKEDILDLNFDNLNYNQIHDKIAVFQEITKNIAGTVVLKGKYDLIFQANKFRLNKTGNPAMTVGGTGDSLAGIVTSLLSQGLNSFDAACLGTYLNGKAGDLAFDKYGNGFKASDLSKFLGKLQTLKN
ncbi:MAG: NAD(P)H-hydrate dehydratase [Methanobrevibacter sp.]|jgi:NAD(P)H-hydrate epimerase|nr:NAD(P)H-hydrate dehydratase [Candidatus Methanovirga basalitermitum]